MRFLLFLMGIFKTEIPLFATSETDRASINYRQSLILDYIKENGSISNVEDFIILNLTQTRVKGILQGNG